MLQGEVEGRFLDAPFAAFRGCERPGMTSFRGVVAPRELPLRPVVVAGFAWVLRYAQDGKVETGSFRLTRGQSDDYEWGS